MTGAWSATGGPDTGVWAQNSPPKAESDCGVTSMCSTPTTPAAHHATPMWTAELLMFAAIVAVLLLAYRLLLHRTSAD